MCSTHIRTGYGNIACATAVGRLATCFYAIIGIPLVLSAMNDLGKWLFRTIQHCMHWKKIVRLYPFEIEIN
jgi:hypothetical protein